MAITMLKSMSEETAQKLLGDKVWQKLWGFWQAVKDDPGSTTLCENLARRWEQKHKTDALPKAPLNKYVHDPVESAYAQTVVDSLRTFLNEINLELSHLLDKEGVCFADMYRYLKAQTSGTYSHTTTQLQEMSRWGMIGMSASIDHGQTFDRLRTFLAPVLDEMRSDTGKAVKRINEMRKTPNFIDYMREWFPYFYIDGALGQSALGAQQDHQLVLDITGLSQTGDFDPDHWCNFNKSSFRKACELLILDVADLYKGNQQPPAQSKVMYVEQMAAAVTTFPAQILLLQGVDPHQVMKGVKGRVEYLFSQIAEYSGKEDAILRLCRVPFFHHPEYWDELGITTGDFLGLDVRVDNPNDDVRPSGYAVTYMGLGSNRNVQRILGFCETAGIDLSDPVNIFRIGYGNSLPYSLDTVSEETIDEVVDHYSQRRWSFPTYVSSDATARYLVAYSDRQAAQLFVKAITSPNNAFQYDGTSMPDKQKKAFIERILEKRPDVVQAAFHEVTLGTIPKKYLPKLDSYGSPLYKDLPKLPLRYRDQHFAGDLGL